MLVNARDLSHMYEKDVVAILRAGRLASRWIGQIEILNLTDLLTMEINIADLLASTDRYWQSRSINWINMRY
jgi:hypothetical protein